MKVAIVEDNPDNMELFVAVLEDDFELTLYRDGLSAVDGIAVSPPDIVLLDFSLPNINGIETLRRLRETDPSIIAIALTAHAMAGDRERFLQSGFNGYFSKPIVDIDALIDLIKSLGGADT